MVSPWLNSAKNTYKIELIEPTLKYNTTTDQLLHHAITTTTTLIQPKHFATRNISAQLDTSTTTLPLASAERKISLKISLDKTLFNDYLLTNTSRLDDFIRHLTVKMHLVWSYYYYEQDINLRIDKIELVNYPSALNAHKKKLFNIDPEQFMKHKQHKVAASTTTTTPVYDLARLFADLLANNTAQPYINVYEAPDYLLPQSETLNGAATQSSVSYCNRENQRGSLVLLKNNFDSTEGFLKTALEQANVMIELLGYNLGNKAEKSLRQTCHNWYFQVIQLENNLIETTCAKRVVDIYKNCKELKERESDLFKIRNHCGNGVVEPELNEQCDCGTSTTTSATANTTGEKANCNLSCCDMKTCMFRNASVQCASGSCCDDSCLFKPSTHLCRGLKSSEGSCDFAEYCSGESDEVTFFFFS